MEDVKNKKSILKKLKLSFDLFYFLFGMLKLIFKPNDISPIFVNGSIIREHLAYKQSLQSFLGNERVKNLVDERYRSPHPHSLEALGKLPEGTLGKTFATHMISGNLEVVFYPPMDDKKDDDVTYLINRSRETHDIHHVLLGYPATDIGEMAISGFYLAQNKVPLSAFLIGVGFLHTVIKQPARIDELFNAITLGWNTGKQATDSVFAIKWEELWAKPISELRKALNVPELNHEEFYKRVDSIYQDKNLMPKSTL